MPLLVGLGGQPHRHPLTQRGRWRTLAALVMGGMAVEISVSMEGYSLMAAAIKPKNSPLSMCSSL